MKTYFKLNQTQTLFYIIPLPMMLQGFGIALMLLFLPTMLNAQEGTSPKKNKPAVTQTQKADNSDLTLEEQLDTERKKYEQRFQRIKETLSSKADIDKMTPLNVQSLAFQLKKSLRNQYVILFIPHDLKWVKNLRDNIQAYAYAVEATRHPMYKGPAPFKKEEIAKAEALRQKIVEAMNNPPPPSKEQINEGNKLRDKLKRDEERKRQTAKPKSNRRAK